MTIEKGFYKYTRVSRIEANNIVNANYGHKVLCIDLTGGQVAELFEPYEIDRYVNTERKLSNIIDTFKKIHHVKRVAIYIKELNELGIKRCNEILSNAI